MKKWTFHGLFFTSTFPSPPVTTPMNNNHTVMCRQITNLQTKFIKQNLENAFKIDHELATCDVNFTGSSGPLP